MPPNPNRYVPCRGCGQTSSRGRGSRHTSAPKREAANRRALGTISKERPPKDKRMIAV